MKNKFIKPALVKIFILQFILLAVNCNMDVLQAFYTPVGVNERFQENKNLGIPDSISLTDPDNFTFVHVTDIHVTGETNPYLAALPSKLLPSDKFIIDSGDLTDYGNRKDFLAYRDMMNATGLPWYSGIGNHDLWFEGWAPYKEVLGSSAYSVTAGKMRIIVLDTANDTLGYDQYEWLKKELAQKTEIYCIVVTHYNLFSRIMLETSQSTEMEEVYNMMRLFEQYRVNYVLMGHSHIYDYRQINGVSYLVGSALKVYSQTSPEEKYFNRITVSNGIFTHKQIKF